MKDQLITLETAKLAKEKGFKEPVLYGWEQYYKTYVSTIGGMYHRHHDKREISIDQISNKNTRNSVSRPTQSLLQRWLREKHNIDAWAVPYCGDNLYNGIILLNNGMTTADDSIEDKNNHEDALEEVLQKALTLIP